MHTRYVAVRDVLLQLLEEGPRHGYQLKLDFETRTGGIWPLNVGQVYTTLDRLQRDGLVAEIDGGDDTHRSFEITEEGRREVKEWLRSSPVDAAPARDELMMKVLVSVARGGRDALAVIDEQRAALLAALQRRRREQRGRAGAAVEERLAHDALLTRIEADVTWLERCEEQVRSAVHDTRRTG